MKQKIVYTCSVCDAQAPKWSGQCFSCGKWGTFQEGALPGAVDRAGSIIGTALATVPLSHHTLSEKRIATGIGEIDRILGGGFVPGSVILLGGEPGIGKSTLCLQIAPATGNAAMYFSGEESAAQVGERLRRLGGAETLPFAQTTNTDDIIATVKAKKPLIAIIDSIQTLTTRAASGAAGSASQVRAATALLVEAAKQTDTVILVTGHVTKEGMVAGPKTLEHLVDVVLYVEGDRSGAYRLLRSVKNRFGTTDEVGVFQMTDKGLREVENPSSLFLEHDRTPGSGQAVTAVMEGRRVFLAEVQALTGRTAFGYPQRRSSGFDTGRLQLLLAVASKHLGLPLHTLDVFFNVVGGLVIKEPAGDLAVCAAILSAATDRVIPHSVVIFGEVGLGGEVRRTSFVDQRKKEAMRLGFTKILSAEGIKHVRDLEKQLW